MFTFHKNDTLPRSRQSSVVGSPLAESPSLTPATDASAASQCSDSVYIEEMHSPERRRRVPSNRRSSVFTIRSRSNTAASTASSIMNSPDSPPALRHVGSHSRLDQGGPRKSIFRGRIGKRLSESVGTGMDTDDYQEVDASRKRASFLRKRKGTNESETYQSDLKNRISSPFDFQHLTHADRHQVAALEQAPETVFGAGWAECAAQLSAGDVSGPQGAHGPHHTSNEDSVSSHSRFVSIASPSSPPHSPRRRDWQQSAANIGSSPTRPSLRLTRSVESFSQPGVNSRAHRHSSSVIAPPRTSSLLPASSIQGIPEEGPSRQSSAVSPSARSKRQSGLWDAFTLSAAVPGAEFTGIYEDSTFVGNAVTTPDDSAIQAMTPPFSPSLEDVAEEPDRFVSPRPAPLPSRLRTPTSPKSPLFESFSFNNPRSPGARTRQRGNSRASPKSSNLKNLTTRPSSQTSETLGSPGLARKSPAQRSRVTRRKSNTWRAIEESWEDDVDYIYEHALEADCDNDWDCVSEDEGFSDRHHALTRAIYEDKPSTPQGFEPPHPSTNSNPTFQLQLPFSSSRLPSSEGSVPELGSASAASASISSGLQTPFHESEGFTLSPSLLLPQACKEVEETSYEDILKEYDGSDCHFPIVDLDESTTSSARSSRVRFSRRSSYDSSLMSSAQSSGLWSSPVRRSASSAGSLPELVHSRRTRQTFSLVVDGLSEQIASLKTFGSDEEDDDVTPPGPSRLSVDRTFFAPGQSLFDNQSYERNRYSHKQALSDGAAQLLASASAGKSRSRAATTSHTRGQEYLRLFPTPPSFSPPITN